MTPRRVRLARKTREALDICSFELVADDGGRCRWSPPARTSTCTSTAVSYGSTRCATLRGRPIDT